MKNLFEKYSIYDMSLREARRVLGLGEDYDEKELKIKHRKLVLENHPDINSGTEERMKAINIAYNIVKDNLEEHMRRKKNGFIVERFECEALDARSYKVDYKSGIKDKVEIESAEELIKYMNKEMVDKGVDNIFLISRLNFGHEDFFCFVKYDFIDKRWYCDEGGREEDMDKNPYYSWRGMTGQI